MRPGPITNVRFQGSFNKKRPVSLKYVAGTALGLFAFSGAIYLFLFSSVFMIRDIYVQDFQRIKQSDVLAHVQSMINTEQWNFRPYRDILLFNAVYAEQDLAQKFPSLEKVRVAKNYFHTLEISGVERVPIGIWCRQNECAYFDDKGVTWGKAIPSSGALLTAVNDYRDTSFKLDQDFFKSIQIVTKRLPELGIALKNIEIPGDLINEFRVHTGAGYYLVFALDSNVDKQLEVLKIFLEEKSKDPSFHPKKYIDLRIDGRVYFDKGEQPTLSPEPTLEQTPSLTQPR
ncbi:MAG: hypothetical protein AAB479_00585 [Patescibacteria group bacterium]